MELSIDALAEIINSIIATLISAIVIFLFIWLVRKRPLLKFKIEILLGENKNTHVFAPEFQITIYNDSIHNIRDFRIEKIKSKHSHPFSISEYFETIRSDECVIFKLPVSKIKLLTVGNLTEFINDVKPQLEDEAILFTVSYRNDDSRPFRKTISVFPESKMKKIKGHQTKIITTQHI